MSEIRVARGLFVAILAGGMAQCIHDFPMLPDRLASHFGVSGVPNGWMTKQQFFFAYALLVLPAAALELWVPRRIAKTGDARINLPHKDYWLAPERRTQTIERIIDQMLFIGGITLLLLDSVFFLTMKANLTSAPSLPGEWMWGMVIGFFVITIGWTISMIRSFKRPR